MRLTTALTATEPTATEPTATEPTAAPLTATEPTAAEPAPPLGARLALLTAAVCGVLALFSTALVDTADSAVFAVLCALVLAAATWAPVVWPSLTGVTVRRMLSFTLLAVTMVLCLVYVVRADRVNVADFAATLGAFLGRLLISVLLAQLFITDKMRDLRVALLLAVGMFVLAVANEPGPVVVVALLVGWPAVVTVLAFDHAAREQATTDTVALARPTAQLASAGLGRIGGVAAISGVVAVLVVLLVPHPPGVRPHQAGGGAGTGTPAPTSPAPSRSTTAYTAGTLDMRARGSLPGTAVADVPIGSPVLWRGAVLDYYDGVSWSAPADNGLGRRLPGGPHFDLPTGDATFGTGAERRDVVRNLLGFPAVLLAPGQPTAVDVARGFLDLPGGLFIAQPSGGDGSYAVTSTSTDLPSVELSRTPVAASAGAGVPGYALQLPATVPERVRLLGERITRWAPDRDAATRAVETYLRGHETYRLDSPVPPPGEDAVDHFLFVAHTGFCEQFAAAEVVLLRSAGVPARLATGFAGGVASGDHRTLIGSDAHAWVEVWYPDIGWAASDPTAGTRLADAGLRDRVSSWLRGARGRLILAGGLLAVATLVAALVWWLGRRARRADHGRGDPPPAVRALPPVLAAFDRLQRALDEVGSPRRPAESVGELAQRPALRQAAGALAVVERTSYGAQVPVGAEADEAERTLDELARQLTAGFAALDR
jgi:protein-glutamine gamma-glutamyltransferase